MPGLYRALRAKIYQLSTGLTSICPQTEVEDHPASRDDISSDVEYPAVDFTDQDYRYKSAVIQISQDGIAITLPGIEPGIGHTGQ